MSNVDPDIESLLVDTADAVTAGHANPHVAFLTPPGVPGVAHDVVALTALIAVADHNDCVIELVRAVVELGDDSALVVPHSVVIGANRHIDGAIHEGVHD